MVRDFHAAAGVAVDVGGAGPLAMAGLAAVNTQAGIAVDDAVRHQYRAGVYDLQSKRSAIESDLIVAIDVTLRCVEKSDSSAGVMADHVGGPGRSVAAIQDQMGRGCAHAAAAVVGHIDARVKIESAAAYADAGPGVVADSAVGDMGQRVDAGDANARPILDGVRIETNI